MDAYDPIFDLPDEENDDGHPCKNHPDREGEYSMRVRCTNAATGAELGASEEEYYCEECIRPIMEESQRVASRVDLEFEDGTTVGFVLADEDDDE